MLHHHYHHYQLAMTAHGHDLFHQTSSLFEKRNQTNVTNYQTSLARSYDVYARHGLCHDTPIPKSACLPDTWHKRMTWLREFYREKNLTDMCHAHELVVNSSKADFQPPVLASPSLSENHQGDNTERAPVSRTRSATQ
ncbi:unnamed protein product [Ranitomeya imitator]|uniref:Uncharacterized protein n=1 Tax=Ranitomeya imitator TaxID=111125 RepID=A0ABN9KVV8_9NEOB|nr:unnamed protein product [Ranitomeya imitator]